MLYVMVKYSCRCPGACTNLFWHAVNVHKVSFLYALSKSEATIFLPSFYYFLPCNFYENVSTLIGAKASQISSVEIRNCLSFTAKPRSTPKLWLPFHNNVIIWQLSGLCASEVGSKTIHQDVLLERRWLIWYNDYSMIYAIPSANKQRRPPPAARP